MSSAPLIAAVLGRIVLGERIAPAGYVAIAGVMVGITVMMSSDLGEERSFAGGLIALGVALSLAGSLIVIRRWPHIRMTPATCTGAALAMVISFPLAAPLSVNGHDFALLAFFGAGQLGVGLILLVTGARLIPAAQSALLGMLEPILGPAWVWMFLGEKPADRDADRRGDRGGERLRQHDSDDAAASGREPGRERVGEVGGERQLAGVDRVISVVRRDADLVAPMEFADRVIDVRLAPGEDHAALHDGFGQRRRIEGAEARDDFGTGRRACPSMMRERSGSSG